MSLFDACQRGIIEYALSSEPKTRNLLARIEQAGWSLRDFIQSYHDHPYPALPHDTMQSGGIVRIFRKAGWRQCR